MPYVAMRLLFFRWFFFIDLYSRFSTNNGLRCVVYYYVSSRHVTPRVFLLYTTKNPATPRYPGCLATCVQPSTGASTGAASPRLVFVWEAVVTNEVGWTEERTECGRWLFLCQFQSMWETTEVHVDSTLLWNLYEKPWRNRSFLTYTTTR